MKNKLGLKFVKQRKVRDPFLQYLFTVNQTIRLTIIPKPVMINMAPAPSIVIEITPFELEPPIPPVDYGF
jgi:hypothetical protein